MSSSGGRERPLGTGPADHIYEWGPGGRILYGVACRDDRGCVEYGPMAPYLWTGTKDEKLGSWGSAHFLPDGTAAFLAGRGIGFLKKSNTLRIVESLPLAGGGESMAWSSDGRYLAFASSMTGHVYVARGDGTGARRLSWFSRSRNIFVPSRRGFSGSREITVFGWQPHRAGRRS